MSRHTFLCEQAIFTSVRTPMGEGYRVIAASPGLGGDEKQAITRNSPSHEGLCGDASTDSNGGWMVPAASFYPLPSGRLCVALSCPAGAEHTGRGGNRIYTHCVVFGADEFSQCAFNPLLVLRAMIAAGLHEPALKPPPVLETISLEVDATAPCSAPPALPESLRNGWGAYLIQALFGDREQIVTTESDWLSTVEALLLALPGPFRATMSFSAGLRFSAGRRQRLNVLRDDHGTTRNRLVGQTVDYVDTTQPPKQPEFHSAWVEFVQRRWSNHDYDRLIRETSRPFTDVDIDARERIGRLYNDIDAMNEISTDKLLEKSFQRLQRHGNDVEQNITDEFLAKAGRLLVNRFASAAWSALEPYWDTLVDKWRSEACAPGFIQPLIEASMAAAMREDVIAASERALVLAKDIPATIDAAGHQRFLDEMLNQLARRLRIDHSFDTERVLDLCDAWEIHRPTCEILDRIRQACTAEARR